jgi:DNA-directed RNA polymerase sigma subunit (sigma70/sigma32)
MSVSHEDVMSKLSPERRVRIEARTQELIEEEMTLRDLRQVQHLTQERVAEILGIE